MFLPLVIFLLTYLLLSFQNIPGIFIRRPAAALIGAVAMVASGTLSMDGAYRLVDYNTIVFILGMMIIVAYLEVSGFFVVVENWILRRATGPSSLLFWVIMASGVLSALFMNDTVCLMFTPVVLRLCRRKNINPVPYLIALATSSNIGSACTPIGNPQNMIIAIHSGIPFASFTLKLLPVAVAGLALNYYVIRRLYRGEMSGSFGPGDAAPASSAIKSRLIYACLLTVAVLLAMLFADVPPPFAAISCAVLLILMGSTRPRDAFEKIDWELLLMFAGLFVVMGGLRESGVVDGIMARLASFAGASMPLKLSAVSAGSALVSNIVSNVPCVVFFANIMPGLGGGHSLWLALAVSSTIAGNLTIIGSVANLIVFESAKDVRVGFREYCVAGAPLAVLLIAVSVLWLSIL